MVRSVGGTVEDPFFKSRLGRHVRSTDSQTQQPGEHHMRYWAAPTTDNTLEGKLVEQGAHLVMRQVL